MQYERQLTVASRVMYWIGRVLSMLVGLFLLADGVMKLFKPDFVVKPTVELGFSDQVIIPLGVVLTVSSLLYLVPPTAFLGAILLTGYLGGAVATHVFAGHGAFEMTFPVVFGVIVWLGLFLQEPRLRALVPWRS